MRTHLVVLACSVSSAVLAILLRVVREYGEASSMIAWATLLALWALFIQREDR